MHVGANQITLGEICGDYSFLGDVALGKNYQYKTWVLSEPELVFMTTYLWQSQYF
jgi:hypothetical protein